MVDLNAQVTINTPTGNLLLENLPHSELVSVGVDGISWRRETVESRYQHGSMLLGAVMQNGTLSGTVRFLGASRHTTIASFVGALSQRSYTVTVTIEGRTQTYSCQPGDISRGTYDKFQLMVDQQEYSFSIPVRPGGVLW